MPNITVNSIRSPTAWAGARLLNNGIAQEHGPDEFDFPAVGTDVWVELGPQFNIANYEWYCDLISSTTVIEGSQTDATWRSFVGFPNPAWYITADQGNDVEDAVLTLGVRDIRDLQRQTAFGTLSLDADGG